MTESSARSCCALVALLCSPLVAAGATLTVPAPYPTIQSAVDAASRGDVIAVGPGVYRESVRVPRELPQLTIEAADPASPPVIEGTPNKSSDGVRVDRAHGIVLRNLRIAGAYNGVRLNRVADAVLDGLDITDSALGVRFNNGDRNMLLRSRIVGTRVEQGIWIDGSRDVLIADTVVADTDEEGIAARNADRLVLLRTYVSGSRGGDAIRVHRSLAPRIEACRGDASQHDGLRITDSPGLVLLGCTANGNRSAGFRIEESSPFATVADVLAAGNTASGNGDADVLVDAARCNAQSCTTPSTTPPPTSTSTTIATTTTTTTAIVTTTSTTSTSTTSTTSTTLPLPGVEAGWRIYVRVTTASGGTRNAELPRSGGAVAVTIPESVLATFAVGDRVYALELPLLGDAAARFTAAADAWIRSHPSDYPDVTGVAAVLWVQRTP